MAEFETLIAGWSSAEADNRIRGEVSADSFVADAAVLVPLERVPCTRLIEDAEST